MATQRGRKSLSELSTAELVRTGPLKATAYMRPSLHLSDAEQVVWRRVVEDFPAGSFEESSRDMLDCYCQQVVVTQLLDSQIKVFNPEWMSTAEGLQRFDKLLAMREREVRSLSSLATRLRITRQSVINPQTLGHVKASVTKTPKPWEVVSGR